MRWFGAGELELEGVEPWRTKERGRKSAAVNAEGDLLLVVWNEREVGIGERKSEQSKEMFGFSGKVTTCKEVGVTCES